MRFSGKSKNGGCIFMINFKVVNKVYAWGERTDAKLGAEWVPRGQGYRWSSPHLSHFPLGISRPLRESLITVSPQQKGRARQPCHSGEEPGSPSHPLGASTAKAGCGVPPTSQDALHAAPGESSPRIPGCLVGYRGSKTLKGDSKEGKMLACVVY